MLPILEREVVEKKKWATNEEILDYYAIGQSTPGIIAINTATFAATRWQKILEEWLQVSVLSPRQL